MGYREDGKSIIHYLHKHNGEFFYPSDIAKGIGMDEMVVEATCAKIEDARLPQLTHDTQLPNARLRNKCIITCVRCGSRSRSASTVVVHRFHSRH